MENNKKKLQIPSTCALLFMLMIVCAILTWIVPAGEFDTEKVGDLNKVIAGTYHTVEASPVGPWATIMAVVQGFYKAAKLMVMIMFVGGAVEILEKTGAIHAAFGKLASKQNLNVNVLVFLVMAFMSIGGAAGVFANPVVALIPIGIILATNLGYDSFTGFLLVYMGAYSGFNVGWANASTIGTAQPIAELPIFSGFSVRVVLNIINFAICYFFTIRYMKTIKADPKKSLNYEAGMSASDSMGAGKDGAKAIEAHLTTKHLISLIGLVVAVAAILVGSVKYKWSYDQIAATFFTLAVVVGLLNGMVYQRNNEGIYRWLFQDGKRRVHCRLRKWYFCDPRKRKHLKYDRLLAVHPDVRNGCYPRSELHVRRKPVYQPVHSVRFRTGCSGYAAYGSGC